MTVFSSFLKTFFIQYIQCNIKLYRYSGNDAWLLVARIYLEMGKKLMKKHQKITREEQVLPNLFIAGTAKSGTTSLYNYLKKHPDIFTGKRKETRFFTWQEFVLKPISKAFRDRFVTEFDEYKALFNGIGNEKYVMDGSIYIMYFKNAIQRVKEYNPDAILLILLRNPADRLFSHYKMLYNRGVEKRKWSKFILDPVSIEGINLMELGLYAEQLENVFNVFENKKVKVMFFDDFIEDTKKTLIDIYNFIGVKEIAADNEESIYLKSRGILRGRIFQIINSRFRKALNFLRRHRRKGLRKISRVIDRIMYKNMELSEKDRQMLTAYYYSDITKLEKITGRDLSSWKTGCKGESND